MKDDSESLRQYYEKVGIRRASQVMQCYFKGEQEEILPVLEELNRDDEDIEADLNFVLSLLYLSKVLAEYNQNKAKVDEFLKAVEHRASFDEITDYPWKD